MAKYVFTRANGPWSYPALGFKASQGDVIETDGAIDFWWEETDPDAVVTIPATPPTSGVEEPDDGAVGVWDRATNAVRFEPKLPESNVPTRLSVEALNGTFVRDAKTLTSAVSGAIDFATSRGNAVVTLEDATEILEDWTASDDWTVIESALTLSGGFAYSSGALARAQRAFAAGPTGSFRASAKLKVSAAAAGTGITAIGVSSTVASSTGPGAGDVLMIGVKADNKRPFVLHKNGAGTINQELSTTALAAGEYLVTVAGDAACFSMSISNADRSVEYVYRIARSTSIFTVLQALVWAQDSRGATGDGVGKFAAKLAISPVTDRTYENRGAWSVKTVYSHVGDYGMRIVIPGNYDPRKGAPVAIYFHGATGSTGSEGLTGMPDAWDKALVNAGYITVFAAGGSGVNFGGPDAMTAYQAAYRWVRDRFNITGTVLVGGSMGGLTALNLLTRGAVPGVAGLVLIHPISDLRWAYDVEADDPGWAGAGSGWRSHIDGRYGITGTLPNTYDLKTDGYDPALAQLARFRGVPVRVYHSPDDTIIPLAQSQAFIARVAPAVNEATLVQITGDHGSADTASTTTINDALAFLTRSLGR